MENIKLDDFTRYKFLSGIRYASDGKNACFAVHQADKETDTYLSNLWLYKRDGDKYAHLTQFSAETNFIWLGDSRYILYAGAKKAKNNGKKRLPGESTQFYKIDINGRKVKKAFCIPKKVESIMEIDSNNYIFTAIHDLRHKDTCFLSSKEKAAEINALRQEKEYEILDEIPFWSNGRGFISKKRTRLYLYHPASGEIEPLTDEYMNVEEFDLDKNRTKAVFTGIYYKDKLGLLNGVYLCDLATKESERLTPEGLIYANSHFITDNRVICTGNDMEPHGINQNQKFYLIEIGSKRINCLTPDLDRSLRNSVLSDCRYGSKGRMRVDGGYLYFVITEGTDSNLHRIDTSGIIEKVVTGKGSTDDYDINGGQILFIGLRNMKLQELYKVESISRVRQITDFNEWVRKERSVAALEKMSVETSPNIYITGWVIKPVEFNKNEKYPAVLFIHGGPKSVFGEVFLHEMQYLANEGYGVFFCNPRGSDGRGSAFADIRGKYGTVDFDDIMKFTDTVLRNYKFIDQLRIGVTGGSYGGFMTNWIIGRTGRFKTAVSEAGISSWTTHFTTSDIGYFFDKDQMGTTPWENNERLWEHSPLKYANSARTPTLFIHSDQDYRCWLVEGLQMFTGLKYFGVESRLFMFRGENHTLPANGRPSNRINRLEVKTSWLDRFLKIPFLT